MASDCSDRFVCFPSHGAEGLTGAAVVFGFVRSLVFFNVLVSSAQTLHNRMFDSILRTPVHFFQINPIGKGLLRFVSVHLVMKL